jgi:hypothetical protein
MRVGILFPVLGLSLLLSANGCIWAPELDRVREDIAKQLPGTRFEREIALSLNPLSLALARAVITLVPDAKEAAPYLRGVRDVTVAVYDVDNLPSGCNVRLPERLEKLVTRGEWELTVKLRERDEFVWVLSRSDNDKLKGLYVIVLDGESLVIVRANGRLERLVMNALREHGGLARHA